MQAREGTTCCGAQRGGRYLGAKLPTDPAVEADCAEGSKKRLPAVAGRRWDGTAPAGGFKA